MSAEEAVSPPPLNPNPTFDSDAATAEQHAENAADGGENKDSKTDSSRMGKRSMLKQMFRVSTVTCAVEETQMQRIKKQHERVEEAAELSWDYNALLFISSGMAGFGVASNSSTTIIGAMLVSPIMGPVIGMTYGMFVQDYDLMRRSFFRECISLLACIIMGFAIGLLLSFSEEASEWPTQEMKSRGEVKNLISLIPVAFLSGLGVALSFGDENVSSLVGVAISVSLLPPAVNAGVLWMHSIFIRRGIIPPKDPPYDFVIGGLISLCLTLVNIICVFLAGMLMFRMKEVLPIENKSHFWTDIKMARRYYTKRAILTPTTDGDEENGGGGADTPAAEAEDAKESGDGGSPA